MDLRSLFIFIAGLVARLSFLARHAGRPEIFVLAPVLIALQDGRLSAPEAERATAPFMQDLADFLRHLARGRETRIGRGDGSVRLPRGCRLGLLHFSPLVQIARLLSAGRPAAEVSQLKRYDFEVLPSTGEAILKHLETSCGWTNQIDQAVKRRFGHTLADYADYLVRLRRKDPVLFVLLMAREFPLAARYLADRDCQLDSQWLKRAARLAEVQRLADIMSFARGRRLIKSSRIRKALFAMTCRKRPSQRASAIWEYRDCLPVIRRLGSGVEAIRALVLGDAASGGLAELPKNAVVEWQAIPSEAKRVAASRCELFSRHRSRHTGARRDVSIDMYYGIPLDQLAMVALTELTGEVANSEGSDDCALIAACMSGKLLGRRPNFGRSGRRAPMIEEVYLRRYGKLGCGGRFDHRLQLDPTKDESLYWMINAAAIGGSTALCRGSVRGLIDMATSLLTQAFVQNRGPIDPRLAAQVTCLVASSLTPATMDPIFASLIDRCLTEREVPANARVNPWNNPAAKERKLRLLRRTFRNHRGRFARFEDLSGRINHPDANAKRPMQRHRPLSVQLAAPRVRASKLHPCWNLRARR